MRYKPRTDLERIAESINEYSYGKIDKNIINQQLKLLNLVGPREEIQNEESDDDISDTYLSDKEKSLKSDSIIEEAKATNRHHKKRAIKINEQAKKILGDFHRKTHFKAVAEFSTSTVKNHLSNISPISLSNSLPKFKKINKEQVINDKIINKMTVNKEIKNFYNDEVKKSEQYENNNEYISLTLPTIQNLDKKYSDNNPMLDEKKKLDNKIPNYKSLDLLKNLAYRISEEEEDDNEKQIKKSVRFNLKKQFSMKKLNTETEDVTSFDERNKIILGNEVFNKDQINLISKKALLKCNYFMDKNKNNNMSLKSGEGKLMNTNGMSINDFEKKYKFNNRIHHLPH